VDEFGDGEAICVVPDDLQRKEGRRQDGTVSDGIGLKLSLPSVLTSVQPDPP